MFILNEQDRKDLSWAMKTHLLEQCVDLGGCSRDKIDFIKESATYEQLLNLCFNKNPSEVYFESQDLESLVVMGLLKFEGLIDAYDGQIVLNESLLEESKEKPGFIRKGYAAVAKKAGEAYEGAKKLPGKAKELGRKAFSVETYKQMGRDVQDWYQSPAGKKAMKRGYIAIAGIAAISVLATWIYKKKFSASAKACAGRTGGDFKSCVAKHKKEAAQAVVSVLKSRKSECNSAKNPEKCNKSLDKLIKRWESKAK